MTPPAKADDGDAIFRLGVDSREMQRVYIAPVAGVWEFRCHWLWRLADRRIGSVMW
jgi:hypothetical protein